MLEMLFDHSLKNKVLIILVVLVGYVHSAEQTFIQKTRTFILTGCRAYLYICVYMI